MEYWHSNPFWTRVIAEGDCPTCTFSCDLDYIGEDDTRIPVCVDKSLGAMLHSTFAVFDRTKSSRHRVLRHRVLRERAASLLGTAVRRTDDEADLHRRRLGFALTRAVLATDVEQDLFRNLEAWTEGDSAAMSFDDYLTLTRDRRVGRTAKALMDLAAGRGSFPHSDVMDAVFSAVVDVSMGHTGYKAAPLEKELATCWAVFDAAVDITTRLNDIDPIHAALRA